MSHSELDDVAAELYAADPAEFVTARKSAAAAAKESGDRALATAIGKLRKPTTVAWAVNLLVREEPEDIAELFDLGDSLREAQRKSHAGDLRELSAARTKAIKSLTTRAVELARSHEKTLDDNASRDIGQTLGAALADPDIALRVRSGRVLTAESYSGFGPAALSLVPDSDELTDSGPSESESTRTAETSETAAESADADEEAAREAQEAVRKAQEALAEAQEDEESARGASAAADADLDDAQTRLAEVKTRLEQLRTELHAAEEDEAQARKAEKSTERESRRLARVLADAEARTAELRGVVEELRGG